MEVFLFSCLAQSFHFNSKLHNILMNKKKKKKRKKKERKKQIYCRCSLIIATLIYINMMD